MTNPAAPPVRGRFALLTQMSARFILFVTATLLGGCRAREQPSSTPAELRATSADGAEVIDDTFEQLYPLFLLPKLDEGPRALLWSRYPHRWVRWTGQLVSVNQYGAQIKHLRQTTTFDVSLQLDPAARAGLRRVKPGTRVTYVGQLEAYNPVFRVFRLTRGNVIVAQGDAR